MLLPVFNLHTIWQQNIIPAFWTSFISKFFKMSRHFKILKWCHPSSIMEKIMTYQPVGGWKVKTVLLLQNYWLAKQALTLPINNHHSDTSNKMCLSGKGLMRDWGIYRNKRNAFWWLLQWKLLRWFAAVTHKVKFDCLVPGTVHQSCCGRFFEGEGPDW